MLPLGKMELGFEKHEPVYSRFPPPTDTKNVTISEFTDEFIDNVQEGKTGTPNLVILGDFNIHISNENNSNAQMFEGMHKCYWT